jgi:hypothetical protein
MELIMPKAYKKVEMEQAGPSREFWNLNLWSDGSNLGYDTGSPD